MLIAIAWFSIGMALTAVGTFIVPASIGPLVALLALPLIFLPGQAARNAANKAAADEGEGA